MAGAGGVKTIDTVVDKRSVIIIIKVGVWAGSAREN